MLTLIPWDSTRATVAGVESHRTDDPFILERPMGQPESKPDAWRAARSAAAASSNAWIDSLTRLAARPRRRPAIAITSASNGGRSCDENAIRPLSQSLAIARRAIAAA